MRMIAVLLVLCLASVSLAEKPVFNSRDHYSELQWMALPKWESKYAPPELTEAEKQELDEWVAKVTISEGGTISGAIIPPPKNIAKFHHYSMKPVNKPLGGIYEGWRVVEEGEGWRRAIVPYNKNPSWYVRCNYKGLQGSSRIILSELRPWPNPLVNTGPKDFRVMRWWKAIQGHGQVSLTPKEPYIHRKYPGGEFRELRMNRYYQAVPSN